MSLYIFENENCIMSELDEKKIPPGQTVHYFTKSSLIKKALCASAVFGMVINDDAQL